MELSMGHLSLLVLHPNAISELSALYDAGLTAPTCPALLCEDEISEDTNISAMLSTAVRTGMLPLCTAGSILGDLREGTGFSQIPRFSDGDLTLALCTAEQVCGTLSADACRGAALFGNKLEIFAFTEKSNATNLKKCYCEAACQMSSGTPILNVQEKLSTEHKNDADSCDFASRILNAFFRETVLQYGADICNIRESAEKNGIRDCTSEALRNIKLSVQAEICG